MKQESEFVRNPRYYHADHDEYKAMIGQERWNWTIAPLFTELFTNPSFRFHRKFYGNLLHEMWNHPELARERGYTDTEILASISVIQEVVTGYGFILGNEIRNLHQTNESFKDIDTAPKYMPWDELVSFAQSEAQKNKVNGIVYGALDPPQIGHARLAQSLWPHCDNLFVGFDKNSVLAQRKGTTDNPRPRFPELAWRMMEVASLPTVDKVFVLPIDKPSRQAHIDMCDALAIRVMGTSEDNVYREQYQEMMDRVGGKLVVERRSWSSTSLMRDIVDPQKHVLKDFNRLGSLKAWVTSQDDLAQSLGFLRDYPNGT